MCQERIDQARHGYFQSLCPLVEIANVLISNLWLIESTLRHHCPLLGVQIYRGVKDESSQVAGRLASQCKCVLNRFRQIFVKVADDFHVVPKVMYERFD